MSQRFLRMSSFLGILLNVDVDCRFFLVHNSDNNRTSNKKSGFFFYKKSKLFFFKLRIEWILVFSSVTSKNLATSKTKATLDQEIKKGPGQKLRQIG